MKDRKLCQCCGKRPRRRKWCGICASELWAARTNAYTKRWYRQRHPRPNCIACGKQLGPRKKKWCVLCAPIETAKKRRAIQRAYRNRPEVRERLRAYQRERGRVLSEAWRERAA